MIILPMNYSRTSADSRMTADDMNRICNNCNEICGSNLKTNWTSNDIVDVTTWKSIVNMLNFISEKRIDYRADYVQVNKIEYALYKQYDRTHHISETAKLTGLSINNATLSPVFNPTTYAYTATVTDKTSIITATSDYSSIIVMVNDKVIDPSEAEWNYGANSLKVKATLNGVTKTYEVTVTCAYQEASLNSLTIGGESIPISEFMSIQTEHASDSFSYTATGSVVVQLNGETTTESSLTWLENSNEIKITVTADDVKEYIVQVDCLYEYDIPANIIAIDISDVIMSPTFDENTLNYDLYYYDDVSNVVVIPDDEVEFDMYWNGAEMENDSTVEWSELTEDVITIVTKSGNGFIGRTYTVTAKGAIVETDVAPMHAGEIIAGDDIPGQGFGE